MKTLLAIALILFINSSIAQIPLGYYDSANGYAGDSLKTKLNLIIKDHVQFPYTSTKTDVWDILKETDKDTLNPNNVLLIYSGWSRDANLEYDHGKGWSREHVWAKSHGNFGTKSGAGTDVHALRPCDVTVNSARNNRWFAECSTEYIDRDGATGSYTSSSQWVWKPNDKVKGDVARMIFYMATRYEGNGSEPDLEVVDSIPSNNKTSAPVHAKLSDLLLWNAQDPVDDWERNRNDIIYNDYQHNRNPFIDHPEFAELIWDITDQADLKIYLNPVLGDGVVTIEWSENSKYWVDEVHVSDYSISIFDELGKLVIEEKLVTTWRFTFPICHDFGKGTYKFVVSYDNKVFSETIDCE